MVQQVRGTQLLLDSLLLLLLPSGRYKRYIYFKMMLIVEKFPLSAPLIHSEFEFFQG